MSQRRLLAFAVPLFVVVSLVTLALLMAARPAAGVQSELPYGSAMYCRQMPAFAAAGAMEVFSTAAPDQVGLVLTDATASTYWYHPSWQAAGTLGPFVFDRAGAIYTIPVPRVNLNDNPSMMRDAVYRIDPHDAQMRALVTIPRPDTGGVHPFHLVGLTYDCDSESLYVATLAGSTRDAERGRILRFDLQAHTLEPVLDDFDALGLAVYNHAHGKQLYIASARQPEVVVLQLTPGGAAHGAPVAAFELPTTAFGTDTRARRLTVAADGTMYAYAVPFTFSLQTGSERHEQVYRFAFANGTWTPLE